MSTSLQAHSTIMGVVRQANPQEDVRRQRVFAWGVTAMLILCTPLLSRWLTVVEGRAKAQSKLRRLYRWVCSDLVAVGIKQAGQGHGMARRRLPLISRPGASSAQSL